VRCSILLDNPFPGPSNARVMVNESFHEAYNTECEAGLVLEDGTFYPNEATSITKVNSPWNRVSMERGDDGNFTQ
jgi:hypothetical protein